MSIKKITEVNCPHCGKTNETMVYKSYNVQFEDTDIREVNSFVCSGCGETVNMDAPLLYHDMERKFMVCRASSGQDTSQFKTDEILDDYRLRVVGSLEELYEKIFIFESGYDDVALEFTKLVLSEHTAGFRQIFIKDFSDKLTYCVTFGNGSPRLYDMESAVYDDAKKLVGARNIPVKGWLKVDLSTILQMIENTGG